MELKKSNWQEVDITEFKQFEKSLKGTEQNCIFEKTVTKTNLECLGIKALTTKRVFKEIKQGNFYEFLDNFLNQKQIKTLFESYVCAHLICQIKDFDVFEKYLDKFVLIVDNWASIDTLKFSRYDKTKLVELSKKYLKSHKPFVRRTGVNIWFALIKDDSYFEMVFNMLNSLKNEEDYYVQMSGAWLLSVCMVYNREKTLKFFELNNTNKFIINKAISKCRDSFRVSKQDKEFLLKYKINDIKN